MQSAITSEFTFHDYVYLKNIKDFLISELCFPDKSEPTEETFEQFKEKHFMKLVKIHAKYIGNIENTIYVSIVYGFCYFVIIEGGTYLMDNNEIYKFVAEYFKKIDKLTTLQKIKYFIFNEGPHNIKSITSLAFYLALKNKCYDDIREMIIEKYSKEISQIHEEKIAQFYINKEKTILIRYYSKAQLYLKIIENIFDEFITLFEYSFERDESIEENMERIVFSKNFCQNPEVNIY